MKETHQPNVHLNHNGYLNELIYHWFVRYNPLYFVSAACFIFGVLLVSRGIQNINWIDGQILLTGVIELYQFGLLAGAFILFRIFNQRRPAVILAVMNIVFLFDCTYQTEHISSVQLIGEISTVIWVLLIALKITALIWIFRVKVPVIGMILPVLGAFGISAGPYLLYYTYIDAALIHLVMTWYGVILAVVYFWFHPTATCTKKLDQRCSTVLARITNAAWMIWAGFYLFHLISWIRFFDINVSLANMAPVFIILPFITDREELAWFGSLTSILLSLVNPPLFSINAFLVGLIFCAKACKDGHPRLYMGGILSFHFALTAAMWSGGPFPDSSLMMILFSALLLVAVGLVYRLISAFMIASIWVLIFWHPRGPRDILEWGGLFIGIGFLSLVTGVILNWKFRTTTAENENSPGGLQSKNMISPVPADGLRHTQAGGTPRNKAAIDLNGLCPYCMIHWNAGNSRCDKCGKSFGLSP
jgi:hypothetical protein